MELGEGMGEIVARTHDDRGAPREGGEEEPEKGRAGHHHTPLIATWPGVSVLS